MTHEHTKEGEISQTLKIVSRGTASFQIKKLVKAGIISKNEEDGKYYIKEVVILEPKEKSTVTPVVKDESDLMEKMRALRRWKQSFGYYYLYPEKFRFGLRDFKK
jgi:predicted transcriptional regulator